MRKDAFRDFVIEQLADLRGLECKALYSGYGLWCDKTFFAVIGKGRLYFRVNEETRPDYLAASSCPLLSRGGTRQLDFLEVPSAVQKDAEQLLEWAEKAITGARQNKKGRQRKVRFR
jgi:DNA transformation protein and related proteins